jgi:hypothetical protein
MRPLTLAALCLLSSCGAPTDNVGAAAVPGSNNEASPAAGDLKPIGNATFVFYNTENLFDTEDDPLTHDEEFTPKGSSHWTQERYTTKLGQLAKAISWAGDELPILVGLGEVEHGSVVQDLANTAPLAAGDYACIHRESPDERGIDLALLVRKAYATVLSSEGLTVPLDHDKTRDVLYVRLGLAGKEELHVFVNHWPSRREGEEVSAPKRLMAAHVVRRKVDALLAADPQARIVIMGDLNDTPTDASVQNGLRAALDVSDHKEDLFDLVAMDHGRFPGSVSHDDHWNYFDQLIVSRGMLWPKGDGAWRALSAASLKDDRLIFHHPRYGDQPSRTFSSHDQYHPKGFSDHLPVVLRIE